MESLFSKMLSYLLSALLVMSMIPLTLRAEDTNAEEDFTPYFSGQNMEWWYLPDGTESLVNHTDHKDKKLTYYCIQGYDQPLNEQDQLYQDILTAKPNPYKVEWDEEGAHKEQNFNEGERSALERWANLAEALKEAHKNDARNNSGEGGFTHVPMNALHDFLSRINGGKEYYHKDTSEHPYDDYGYMWSGLTRGNCLNDAYEKMISNCKELIDRKPSNDLDNWRDSFKVPGIQDDTTERTVYYTVVSQVGRNNGSNMFHPNNAMLIFYDFEVMNVVPDAYNTDITEELAQEELSQYEDGEEIAEAMGLDGTKPVGTLNELAKSNGGVYKNYTLEDNSGSSKMTNGHFENRSLGMSGDIDCAYVYTDSESVTTSHTTKNATTNSVNVGGSFSYSHTWGKSTKTHVNEGIIYGARPFIVPNNDTTQVSSNTITVGVHADYGWANCLTNSNTTSENSTITENHEVHCSPAKLAPHTGTDCYLNITDTTQRIDFKNPLCVTFKVAFATCCGDVYVDTGVVWNSGSYDKDSLIFKFGEGKTSDVTTDAISNVYNLYNTHEGLIQSGENNSLWETTITNARQWHKHGDNSEKDNPNLSINWTDQIKNCCKDLAWVPMVDTEMQTSVKAYHASITQGEVYPLYSLKNIVADSSGTVMLDTNATCDINNLVHLTGYDAGESGTSITDVAEYYGFNQKLGRWVLCDENGTELPDQGSSVVSITDGVTLTSKGSNGDAYIRYIINEDCYHAYYQGEGEYTKNSDLTGYPIIKVSVVNGAGFTGTLKVEGDLEIQINQEFDFSSDSNTLKVYGVDSKGQPTLIPNENVTWYPVDTSWQQNSNEPSKMTPTQTGEFKVGIEYGGVQYKTEKWGASEFGYPVTVINEAQTVSTTPTSVKTANKGNFVYSDSSGDVNEKDIKYRAKSYSNSDPNQVVNWMAIDSLYDVAKIIDAVNGVESTRKSKADIYAGFKHLKEMGVIGNIDPNDDLTRENFAKLCYKLSKYKGMNVSANDCILDCADVSEVSSDAYNAVNWTVSRGILKIKDNYIYPKSGFTQQEFQESIKQILQNNVNLHVQGKSSYWKEMITLLLYIH